MTARVDAAPYWSGEPPRPAEAEGRVLFASSVGTIFEWYDFYLYAILAPFFAGLFFPPGHQTAALLGAFGAYAAGFLVRPLGALVFGRAGDLLGRKHAFLVTIAVMGLSTLAMGSLPTFASIGHAAPVLLVVLRLAQGLALGGEYGGAATYVAEHAADGRRGRATGWLQATATLGMLAALVVIGLTRSRMEAAAFASWGWRIPFWLSVPLLLIPVYVRYRLAESPIFQRMQAQGEGSKAPLVESFLRAPNNRRVALALLGATAGQGVVWYAGQFYALYFLLIYLQLDFVTAYWLVGIALVLGTPFFMVFGALSDRIGRKPVILAGCLLAALTYFPLFKGLTHLLNPDLERYQTHTSISVAASDCTLHVFVGPWSRLSACDQARDYLNRAGLSFASLPRHGQDEVVTRIGDRLLVGFDPQTYRAALQATGYPGPPHPNAFGKIVATLILWLMVIYAAMVYGPIAAFLVELFPARLRYSSVSLPYHLGNGWFGGLLPLLATAMVAAAGSIYQGLWYPVVVAAATFVIGAVFLEETKDRRIHAEHAGGMTDASLR